MTIRSLRAKHRLSERAFKTLVLIGPFSWALQMSLLTLMRDPSHEVISAAVIIAALCFLFLVGAVRDERISDSAAAQAILWGELVFPLVLVSLLPNGAWTLFSLVL